MKRLFNPFIKNIAAIIVSVAIACVIWLSVSFTLFPDVTKTIYDVTVSEPKVTDAMMRDMLSVKEVDVTSVNVKITGKRYEIGGLENTDLSAELDLSDVVEGKQEVPIIIKTHNPLSNVLFDYDESLYKTEITVVKTITEHFPLEFAYEMIEDSISAADGFMIDTDNTSLSPESVIVTGDNSLVSNISSIQIEPVIDSKSVNAASDSDLPTLESHTQLRLSRSRSFQCGYVLIDSMGAVIDTSGNDILIQPPAATLTVAVIEKPETKTVALTVNVTSPPGFQNFNTQLLKSKAVLEPSEILLQGSKEQLENLDSLTVTVTPAELSENKLRDGYLISLDPLIPEGLTETSNLGSVRVSFRGVEDYTDNPIEVTLTADTSDGLGNITLNNIPPGLTAEIPVQNISVNLVGPAAALQSVSAGHFRFSADLSKYSETPGEADIALSYWIEGESSCWVEGKITAKILFKTKEQEITS